MKNVNALTRALKRIVKENSRFYVHFERQYDAPSYSDDGTFTLTARNGSSIDEGPETRIDIPGRVGNGHSDEKETHNHEGRTWVTYCGVYRPAKGYWGFWSDHFRDAILSLPDDAEITLRVALDAGTNQNLIDCNFHSDHILLQARFQRGRRSVLREFLLDVSTGPHNSARFGRGMFE